MKWSVFESSIFLYSRLVLGRRMASEMDTVEMDGGMNHDGKAKEEAVVYDNALREDIGRKGKNAYYVSYSKTNIPLTLFLIDSFLFS